MARDSYGRVSGFKFLDVPYENAIIHYNCINCKIDNYVDSGKELLSIEEANKTAEWKCHSCGFIHSSKSPLPFKHWATTLTMAKSLPAIRFWNAFFKNSLESIESYYKMCGACGRTLPFRDFAKKSSSKGPLIRQFECRACKAAANAELNPLRTRNEMLRSGHNRRVAELFTSEFDEAIDIDDLFQRFESKCFGCDIKLNKEDRQSYQIDHILPNSLLWPLSKQNACLLCKDCNQKKKHNWPNKFFKSNDKLVKLSKITGANLELLTSKIPQTNTNIDVNAGVAKYLTVREQSNLSKRVQEIKKIIEGFNFVDKLSEDNKNMLGYTN